MISHEIRKRLRRLNTAALKARSRPAESNKPPGAGSLRQPANDTLVRRPRESLTTRLDDIVTGQEVVTPAGNFLLIDRGAPQLSGHGEQLIARYSYCFEMGAAVISDEPAPLDLVRFANCDPTKSIFLDIETTGLCGSPLFLVGLLLYRQHHMLVRQLFARDYSEEKPLLEYLLRLLHEFDMVVTFNGKSFDLPYIRDRCSFNKLSFRVQVHHLDLLHQCRRRWKEILPDCRLQTLESRICYRYRPDDIPGSEIPRAYHHFVRTGDARQIRHILHHNALDLLTMVELTLKLLTSET